MSDSVWPHSWQPTRLCWPWDSPGENTGVGCHFLLQCMKVKVKVKSLSRVQLFATPWTAAYQAPPSMGFSRQEYWSRLPLPSPKVNLCHSKWKDFLLSRGWVIFHCATYEYIPCVCAKLLQSCPILCNPMDRSPSGSSVHGVLQARILE